MAKRFDRLVHRGHIKDGKLELENPRWFRGMLQLYEDCKVTVLVERQKRGKSAEQLGYLFGVVYPIIADSTGMTIEEVHLAMKHKFLSKRMHWRGTNLLVTQGVSDLKVAEMAEFITNVCVEGADLGCIIPEPDKLYSFK